MLMRLTIILWVIWILGGCSLAPGMHLTDRALGNQLKKTEEPQPIPPEFHEITPALIAAQQHSQPSVQPTVMPGSASAGYHYRVGPNDILSITVWDHPELTIPAGEFRSADAAGHLVAADGSIFFPYIGKLHVAGRTLGAIRYELTRKLSAYIKNPQLDVRVAAYRSQKVSVTGQVKKPGIIPLTDVPLTLVEAVNKAGGEKPDADLTRVTLVRDGRTYHFNLYDMLENGHMENNYVLKNGDIINVPDKLDNKVFVVGEVGQQTVHVMHKAHMSLADALGQSGGVSQRVANAKRIFVIRGAKDSLEPEVFHLDATSPTALLLATRFELKPLDVVYVATSNLTRWNRVLSQLLPTVQGLYEVDRLVNP